MAALVSVSCRCSCSQLSETYIAFLEMGDLLRFSNLEGRSFDVAAMRVLQRPVKWDDWLHRRHNELPCKVGQKRIIEEAKPKSERLEVVKGG